MLTDKTHSTADFDDPRVEVLPSTFGEEQPNGFTMPLLAYGQPHPIMREPAHKTRRRARRASARRAFEAAKLAHEVAPEKNPRPKNWRTRRPPEPTVTLWFSGVREKGSTLSMKRKHNLITFPTSKVTIICQRGHFALVRVPVSLAAKCA